MANKYSKLDELDRCVLAADTTGLDVVIKDIRTKVNRLTNKIRLFKSLKCG